MSLEEEFKGKLSCGSEFTEEELKRIFFGGRRYTRKSHTLSFTTEKSRSIKIWIDEEPKDFHKMIKLIS
jgi:hypothetical protein